MSREWVTADQHFNHFAICKFTDRPFKNVWAMNTFLIDKWNERVSERDVVYCLGDLGWGDLQETLDILNGKIIYIHSLEWTHERATMRFKDRFESVSPLMTIQRVFNHKKIYITMCHYCLRTWPKAHYNSWHLFGHSHGRLKSKGKSWDVGVDNNNYVPLSLDEDIPRIMAERPDNPAYQRLKHQKSKAEMIAEASEDELEEEK